MPSQGRRQWKKQRQWTCCQNPLCSGGSDGYCSWVFTDRIHEVPACRVCGELFVGVTSKPKPHTGPPIPEDKRSLYRLLVDLPKSPAVDQQVAAMLKEFPDIGKPVAAGKLSHRYATASQALQRAVKQRDLALDRIVHLESQLEDARKKLAECAEDYQESKEAFEQVQLEVEEDQAGDQADPALGLGRAVTGLHRLPDLGPEAKVELDALFGRIRAAQAKYLSPAAQAADCGPLPRAAGPAPAEPAAGPPPTQLDSQSEAAGSQDVPMEEVAKRKSQLLQEAATAAQAKSRKLKAAVRAQGEEARP